MLEYKKLAVIDHDWSLYRIYGNLGRINFNGSYAIIHDEDCISDEFWSDSYRVTSCIINANLGRRLEAYYE